MTDYVEKIAEKLNAGTPVFLYTLGGDTLSVIKELDFRFGLKASGVCDGDDKKQGKTYRGLNGLVVTPFDEALAKYPRSEFFITSMDYRFQIMGQLLENGKIPPERIINYEPVEKRRTCSCLEKFIDYDEDGKLLCCWTPQSPAAERNNFKKFYDMRKNVIDLLINNAETPEFYKSYPACNGCAYIKTEYYPVARKSWWLNYFGFNPCNYKCSYCNVKHIPVDKSEVLDMDACLRALKDNEMLSEWYGIVYSTAGEPTLHPARKKLYDAFDGFAFIVNTNGSILDYDLFDLMNREKVKLVISVDAGTRETYQKIKSVDTFDKVRKNLIKYSEAKIGITALKYVFIPGINDNDEDVNGFINLCLETNCGYVIISYAYGYEEKMTEKTYGIMKKLSDKLKELDFFVTPYTQFETPEYAAKIRGILDGGEL